jgi:hypothetical protein
MADHSEGESYLAKSSWLTSALDWSKTAEVLPIWENVLIIINKLKGNFG